MSKKIETISKKKLTKSNEKEYKISYKPKTYHSSFLNTVNKDAHSSRPETVGSLATDLFPKYIEQATEPSPADWKRHYKNGHFEQYENGLKKFKEQFEKEKKAINDITDEDLTNWYDDLLFNKTFSGLYVEDAILKDIASKKKKSYQKSSSSEESKGIDGYIGDIPYSVKAESYKDSAAKNTETINAKMVYYRYTEDENKKNTGVEYYIEEDEE